VPKTVQNQCGWGAYTDNSINFQEDVVQQIHGSNSSLAIEPAFSIKGYFDTFQSTTGAEKLREMKTVSYVFDHDNRSSSNQPPSGKAEPGFSGHSPLS